MSDIVRLTNGDGGSSGSGFSGWRAKESRSSVSIGVGGETAPPFRLFA